MIDPISLTLTRARMIGGAIALLALVLASAAGGWMINGWRLDAAYQRELAAKDRLYGELKDKVTEQNAKIADLNAATRSADDLRKQAELHAASVTKRIGDRSAAVGNSKATNCDGVLREAWENWQ